LQEGHGHGSGRPPLVARDRGRQDRHGDGTECQETVEAPLGEPVGGLHAALRRQGVHAVEYACGRQPLLSGSFQEGLAQRTVQVAAAAREGCQRRDGLRYALRLPAAELSDEAVHQGAVDPRQEGAGGQPVAGVKQGGRRRSDRLRVAGVQGGERRSGRGPRCRIWIGAQGLHHEFHHLWRARLPDLRDDLGPQLGRRLAARIGGSGDGGTLRTERAGQRLGVGPPALAQGMQRLRAHGRRGILRQCRCQGNGRSGRIGGREEADDAHAHLYRVRRGCAGQRFLPRGLEFGRQPQDGARAERCQCPPPVAGNEEGHQQAILSGRPVQAFQGLGGSAARFAAGAEERLHQRRDCLRPGDEGVFPAAARDPEAGGRFARAGLPADLGEHLGQGTDVGGFLVRQALR